jgi:hypothetical protein
MPESSQSRTILLGLLGAAAGGGAGYFAFFWIASHGFYALVVPGGLLGIAAGLCARRRCPPLAVICGIASLLLGLITEWRFRPFVADAGMSYFLTHIHNLSPVTMIMIVLGAIVSYSAALGRNKPPLAT